ncbi:MAG: Nif3-like dinuclear metal center hexameric protein [Peptostreptococcus sp.]|uniref:Nif3-like dinuclear metal center hexameric protein n=1 Tax=Peptostreptococcus sp. TaxID=1262 RepID=UPI002FCBD5C5
MKLYEVIDTINKKYPEYLQYNWDNSGLNIGDKDSEIKKIMLTLEVTESTVDEAIENNVDLIISHHPFLFSKINKINKNDIKGNLIYKLISNSISVYCMHTSYDVAIDGLNDYFFELMGISNEYILDESCTNENYRNGESYGLGRVGSLEETMKVKEFISKLKSKLSIKNVRYVGKLDKKIKTVAVVTGSGAEFFEKAKELDIDVLVTGDMKYHQAMDALEIKMSVIDCGHYGTEHIFADSIIGFLIENLKDIEISKSSNIIDPFTDL